MEYKMMVNFSFIKRYHVRGVVGTFVKINASDYKQQILLLQNIFYDSSAILIIKHNKGRSPFNGKLCDFW